MSQAQRQVHGLSLGLLPEILAKKNYLSLGWLGWGKKCEFEATNSHFSTSVSFSWQLGSLELMKLGLLLRDHDWCFSCQAQLLIGITWET